MKYKLVCQVKSLANIGEKISFTIGNKEYVFTPNRDGFLSSIEVITNVDNPDQFLAKMTPNLHGKGHHHLEIKNDEEITNDLERDMQYLESSIMFGASPTKIDWEDPEWGWIPENDEDRDKVNVLQFSVNREYPKKITEIDKQYLMSILETREHYEELTELKGFFNEGSRFFDEFKYINAFYNFYFVIEDLYGDGNTKNTLIMKSFKESENLGKNIEKVLTSHILNHEKHSKNLDEFLKDMGKTTSPNDIIEFLVLTRGRLHHYSRKNTQKIGTPFNQRDYETIAFLAMGIALHGVLQEILFINRELGIAE